jgi:hypothetical protein
MDDGEALIRRLEHVSTVNGNHHATRTNQPKMSVLQVQILLKHKNMERMMDYVTFDVIFHGHKYKTDSTVFVPVQTFAGVTRNFVYF